MKQVHGIIAYDVDLKTDSATVLYDPAKINIEKLKQAVTEAGYKVRGIEELAK